MKKAFLTALFIGVLLVSLAQGMQIAHAQSLTITIKADGSITPSNAAIQTQGDIYVVTGDLTHSITVERGNIVLDGANHTLQGPGSSKNFIAVTLMASNVTLTNFRISGWKAGVYGAFNNNTITNNMFTDNYQGITIYADNYVVRENSISGGSFAIFVDSAAIRPQGDNNFIIRNEIANNNCAFDILNSNGTRIAENSVTNNSVILTLGTLQASINAAGFHMLYNNNFVNNSDALGIPFGGPFASGAVTVSPAGQWDNGTAGNYWSDYSSRYPNAKEIDHSGIGNTPYMIEDSTTWSSDYANGTHLEGTAILGTAIDRYPLITPFLVSTSTVNPSPTPSTSALIVSLSESASALNFGNTINFTSVADGGTKPYTYAWYIDNQFAETSSSPYFSTNTLAVGSHSVYVQVNDANNNSERTNTVSFEVLPAPSSSSSLTPTTSNSPTQQPTSTPAINTGYLEFSLGWIPYVAIVASAIIGIIVAIYLVKVRRKKKS